jgi:hypothetical protein
MLLVREKRFIWKYRLLGKRNCEWSIEKKEEKAKRKFDRERKIVT